MVMMQIFCITGIFVKCEMPQPQDRANWGYL
jgi:hypothetical protein